MAGDAARQRYAALAGLQLQHGLAGGDFLGHHEGFGHQFVAPSLDLAHVEHGIDEREKMRARAVDQIHIFALAIILELAEIFAGEDFRKAENGVERRAQFMADGRQEA